MKTMQLKKDFFWVGSLDPNLRVFDIIMRTEFGTTYNAYVLKGSEKTALFETVKVKYFDEYLQKLSAVTDIAKIDYLIVNHTEPDHAGSVEKLLALNPRLKIVATPTAINFLKQIVNHEFYSIPVKENDTLSLGNKTLRFLALPNLHWPDTMYTYLEEDHILVTCDSFGSHYSHAGILRSTITDEEGYLRATKYYFDMIIGPFRNPYMTNALLRIKDLQIDMIAPGHGPVLDDHIEQVLTLYKKWCTVISPFARKTVVIPYVSAYGYTKELAEQIAKGIRDSGNLDVHLFDMVTSDPALVAGELGFADGILFGTPTILGEALKPIWDLTTSMFAGIHGKKPASAFGSYGWSGEGVPHLLERLKQLNMKVVDGFKVRFKPSEKDLIDAFEYGYNFGCVVQNITNKPKVAVKKYVRCLICGAVFEAGLESCPVCGVGPENFVPAEAEETSYRKNTSERFVILGSGVAAVTAAKAIRDRNETAKIVLVSNEPALPYNRPMLTKDLLAGMDDLQIAINGRGWYEDNKIELLLGKQVTEVRPAQKEIGLADGQILKYDKCIYALGAECFIPPFKGVDKPEIVAIRRIADVQKIAGFLKTAKNCVVIGGGILGLEAAWEIKKAKVAVTVLELADRVMPRQIDAPASDLLQTIVKAEGIAIHTSVVISEITGEGHVQGVRLADGREFPADFVVVSTGVRANAELAKRAGADIGKSVKVNEKMETSLSDLYAAGDCAEYAGVNYAIWPQALDMGKAAGANAAGDLALYKPASPAVTLNAMNTRLYAIGDNGSNPALVYKTMEFKDPAKKTYEKYYFANNRLVGVILIGDLAKMIRLTEAIEAGTTFQDLFQ